MHYFYIKLLLAFFIFLAAFLVGIGAILFNKRERKEASLFFARGDYFARGVFLGAGLLHLLPDALRQFAIIFPHIEYPVILTLCLITIFLLQLIERGLPTWLPAAHSHTHTSWMPYLLMIFLTVHSLVEGAVLGIGTSLVSIIIVFIAIISHKGAESFALAIEMSKNHLPSRMSIYLLIIFSCMTPISILLGSVINCYLQATSGLLAQSIFGGIAAGTFLYIAMNPHGEACERHLEQFSLKNFLSFGLGISLMAGVALWL